MAGRPKAKSKKSQSKSNPKKKKKGPTSPIYGQKHKSLAELHGVDVLSIQIPEFDEPISPRSSLNGAYGTECLFQSTSSSLG